MKHILIAPFLFVALSLPAMAEKLSVAQISGYLNSFSTARAEFTQVNADGTVSTGVLSMRRPGRARFDYAADGGLVIAGGGQVAIFDPVSNTTPEQYPLRKTPLHHILASNVNLGASGMVTGHEYDGTATSLTVQDPEHPDYGTIRLVFTDAPARLRQWVITNDTGGETTVILGDMQTDVALGTRLFNITLEMQDRGLN